MVLSPRSTVSVWPKKEGLGQDNSPIALTAQSQHFSSPFSILYLCHTSLVLCHMRLKKTRKRHLSHGLDSNDLMDRAVEPANL